MGKSQQWHRKYLKNKNYQKIYNRKHLKTKIKSCKGKFNTDLYNDKLPNKASQYTSLSVILIDSVYREDKNYYPWVFLEECKYVIKEKKTPMFITDNIEISPDDSDEADSDEGKTNIFLEKYKKFFKLAAGKSFFWKNIINFSRADFFYFSFTFWDWAEKFQIFSPNF